MIRILQQDNRIIKIVFGVIIVVAIAAMTITLVPGIFNNDGTDNPAVYATVRSPGVLGRFGVDSVTIQSADVQREAQSQMRQQNLPDFYMQFLMSRAGQIEVERAVLEREADRLGLQVSNADLRNYLQTGPYSEYLFPGGHFIGQDRYIDFVEQYFQLPVAQFENEVKSDLELQRLQALVTGGVTVSDQAVRAQYLQTGTKVKFAYAVVSAADVKQTITPSDAELQAFFKQNAARYAKAIPETRKIEFIAFDSSSVPGGVPAVSDAEAQNYYSAHQDQYKTPEEVKTRHILIAVAKDATPQADAAAKTKAEDVLKQLKAGGNFSDLAKKYSDDPGSKDQGGELPLIPTSQLDPAYAKAAMALNPGQTSGLVRSQFGYHIIQTEQKQQAGVKDFGDVKDAIEAQLKTQNAAQAAQNYAAKLAAEAKSDGLQKTADTNKLHLQTSDYVASNGVIPSLPDSTGLLTAAFAAAKGAAPQSVSTGDGYAVFQVEDVKAAHAPEFAEYKTQILSDYRDQKAPELLNAELIKLSDRARVLGDLTKAAAEMNVPVKTSDLVGRDAQVPDIGALTGTASVVFTMPKGGISGPVNEGANGSVLQLLDKQEPAPDDVAKNFAATKGKLLDQQRQEAFSIFVGSLMQRYEKAGAIAYSRKQTGLPISGS